MAIKTYNRLPRREEIWTVTDYSGLSKVAPEKSLLEPKKKTSGRNMYGRITVVTMVAETVRNTVSSTSRETKPA